MKRSIILPKVDTSIYMMSFLYIHENSSTFHVSLNIAFKKTSLIKQNHLCMLSSSSFHQCKLYAIIITVDENFIISPLMDGNASTWAVSIMMQLT